MPEKKPSEQTQSSTRHTIRVAILSDELLGWGSGKRMFPEILQGYTWKMDEKTYTITTQFLSDKDIMHGHLRTEDFDVLLVPGGGVGDGQSITKGFKHLRSVRKWKYNIASFIKDGGGYVGICGGTALLTDLKTGEKKPRTFLERQYHKSALGVTCVSSYYKTLAFPLFYPFQKNHPQNIGATAYVFSFAPGITTDRMKIHTGGAPIDFQLHTNHPIFSDVAQQTERIRWWAVPALIVPEHPDREVEWGPRNVRVNLVLPGWQRTDLSEGAMPEDHDWPDHALRRPPALEEVARTIVHMTQLNDLSGQVWNCDSRDL